MSHEIVEGDRPVTSTGRYQDAEHVSRCRSYPDPATSFVPESWAGRSAAAQGLARSSIG